jgi:negative regulator of sigma E activity
MNSHPQHKLSDESLSDLLAPNAAASDDSELAELKAALRSYRTETLDWAERRSATQPSLVSRARESRWAAVPQWSLAAVAILAVTAGVVHFAGYGAEDVAPAAAPVTASAPVQVTAQDEIAADNQLLGSIDQALRYDSVFPTGEIQVKPAKTTAHRNTHSEVTD